MAAFLGGLITLALIVTWFALNDSLSELWQTTFVYPMHALAYAPGAGLKRLLGSMYWFAAGWPFLFY